MTKDSRTVSKAFNKSKEGLANHRLFLFIRGINQYYNRKDGITVKDRNGGEVWAARDGKQSRWR